ncbi:MAG TPA: DUF922 domain-containing Zn-dependent protease [Gammaproteobacteria bacterium]|nr:DUF922 domain-containing Zn-dependent protease [Gammaproteobacteria bacterium]
MRAIRYLIFIFLYMISFAAIAMPIATERESYYAVYGATANQLRDEMRTKGPLGDDGVRYDAYTRYYVKWRFTYQKAGHNCAIRTVNVTLDTKYDYPEWRGYADASPQMRQNWDNYITKLKAHERGHAVNGWNCANEIDSMLTQLQPMDNCGILGKSANDKAYAILNKYKNEDVDYDKTTDHGRVQGVILQDE